MKLTAKVYKTPSCAAFVIVEDKDHGFAATSASFTGTHSDYLADVFAATINGTETKESDTPKQPFWKRIF